VKKEKSVYDSALTATHGGEVGRKKPVVHKQKTGRNEQCPCGSGKKYKNCCGRKAEGA
jgi:preprotein translocase subunit SecA